jgi:hypothetical protein
VLLNEWVVTLLVDRNVTAATASEVQRLASRSLHELVGDLETGLRATFPGCGPQLVVEA